jgi:hypothetical protein
VHDADLRNEHAVPQSAFAVELDPFEVFIGDVLRVASCARIQSANCSMFHERGKSASAYAAA